MSRKRRRKTREPQPQIEKMESLKRDLQAEGYKIEGVQVWEKNKLSVAIGRLIQPFEHEADSYDSYHTLVGFACAAWNASLVKETERSAMVDEFIRSVLKRGAPREVRDDFRAIILELIERKLKLFPKDTRFIANYELEDLGKGDYHLTIASVMPAEE